MFKSLGLEITIVIAVIYFLLSTLTGRVEGKITRMEQQLQHIQTEIIANQYFIQKLNQRFDDFWFMGKPYAGYDEPGKE